MKWRKRCISIAIISMAVFGWSFLNIFIVKWRAEHIAKEKPYCLQVTKDRFDYQEVSNVSQLSGLKMRATYSNGGGAKDFKFTFHALLAVQSNKGDTKLYNWSYRKLNFVLLSKEQLRNLSIYEAECKPVDNFFRRLSWS